MEHLLNETVQEKRQFLIEELINLGIFKINDKHLYEWTLSELEKEFEEIEKEYMGKTGT
ncbi:MULTISPECIES: Fur-regulated basic protein FbpA [Neobacillus]|uniref:Fur-regulated basic protein FbpA n=1 Tax=Neobacillus citreus TaxID=2833578 RepID=A0A942SU61_9BACI|nr:Fur-regulated basic protein FbpA [Neobacillus citreus]MCH6266844.1 Fur-regulated basic protein FbpA [Neobacillus citreus]